LMASLKISGASTGPTVKENGVIRVAMGPRKSHPNSRPREKANIPNKKGELRPREKLTIPNTKGNGPLDPP